MKDTNVIYAYTLKQAIEDGVLVEIFKNSWNALSGGKPIVATSHWYGQVSQAGLMEPEEERMFHTKMNSQTVWVIEDGAAFTLLYPEDY